MEGAHTDPDPPENPSKRQTYSQPHCRVCYDLSWDILKDNVSVSSLDLFLGNDFVSPRNRGMRCASFYSVYEDFVSSSQSGCKTCSLILCASEMYKPQATILLIQVLVDERPKNLQKFLSSRMIVRYLETRKDGQREQNEMGCDENEEEESRSRGKEPEDEDGQQGGWRESHLELYQEEQDFPDRLPIVQARTISRYPRSSTCMDLLASWLSQCCDNHEICPDPSDVTLPTRVISVGSDTTFPRLYTPSHGTKGQYVALSHCWGGDVPLKTTTTNIEEHHRGIPEGELPRTFLDAVHIARKLQIPFLWIDSLCIMQDSRDDWNQESGRMGSYYSGAILTIAADYAANSSEGCLKERPQEAWSVRIPSYKTGLKNDVYIREDRLKVDGVLGHTSMGYAQFRPPIQLHGSQLIKRSWALQEWVLSKRVVHFTNEELVWECQQEVLCECSIGTDEDKSRGAFRKVSLRSLVEDLPALYDQWMNIVSEFSRRSITYETDRLPAISGIAEIFSNETKDEYACGIWKNYPDTLVWKPEHGGVLTLRQDRFYAPSWSWASIKTPIKTHELVTRSKHRSLTEILNVDSTPETTNHFGHVKKHAKLTIRGHVFRGRVGKLKPIEGIGGYVGDYFLIGKQCSTYLIKLDFPPVSPGEHLPRGMILPEDRSTFEPDLHPGDEIVVLVVYHIYQRPTKPRPHGWDPASTGGLVLKAVDESDSIYRRVGTYEGEWWEPGFPEWDYSEEKTVTLV